MHIRAKKWGIYLLLAVGIYFGITVPVYSKQIPMNRLPIIDIPYMAKPPVIDGIIHKSEWKDAVAISGVADGDNFLYPRPTTFYLGWNAGHLYIACKTWVMPNYKFNDSKKPGTVGTGDDGLELGFQPLGKNVPPGSIKPEYKFNINAFGIGGSYLKIANSQAYGNFYPQFKTAASLTTPGSAPKGGRWLEIEMSATPKDFQLDGPNHAGDQWRMLLGFNQLPVWTQVRIPINSGYFDPSGFVLATLVKRTPAIHVTMNSLPGFCDGTANVKFSIYNPTTKPVNLNLLAQVSDKWGYNINKAPNLLIKPGKTAEFSINEKLLHDPKTEGIIYYRVNQKNKTLFQYFTYFKVGYPKTDMSTSSKPKIVQNPFPVTLKGQYLPSYNLIYYKLIPNIEANKIENVKFKLNGAFFEKTVRFTQNEEKFHIPKLEPGKYKLELLVKENGRYIKSGDFKFVKQNFIWEHNTLGKTDKVFKPFTPIKVNGKQIDIVLRKYTINDFGLLDSVISEGKEILAGPIVLKGNGTQGNIQWTDKQGRFTETKPNKAVYKASVQSGPINIKTISTIWFDGTIKINMKLSPGQQPEQIKNLYIEIPIKEKYAHLFHEVTDGPRINYAGKLPKGNGIIWNSTQAGRYGLWLDSFVPYIWLGREEQGIVWFGENDKGWLTAKNMKTPIQTIERKDGKIILKVYLIDEPVLLKTPTKLVFGLDVSPTKPMPNNWRKHLRYIPGGLPVVPYGGLDCFYKGPYKDHWKIVDKILECRKTRTVPKSIKNWFEAFNKKYNPPPAWGTWPWLNNVLWFAGWASRVGLNKPLSVYEEGMGANTVRAPWKTYQYEWTNKADLYNKHWPTYNIYRQGINVDPGVSVTYIKSYRDYGLWYANQWLKRGVSLYWDNTFPRISYNYRTTDAYKVGNEIQPCVTIWQQRKYQMRVWNLLSEYRKKLKHPWTLQFINHMTNTLILPVMTFATADLDFELVNSKPAKPAFLRTESIGRQVGNYPLCLHKISGDNNETIKKLPEAQQEKIEWGMRMVHDIGPYDTYQKTIVKLNNIVFNFGYGNKDIKVDNYWKSKPILQVNNKDVKWIGMINKNTKEMLLVFSSWNPKQIEITVNLNTEKLGFNVDNKKIVDVLTGKPIKNNEGEFNLTLSAPYGVKIIKIE